MRFRQFTILTLLLSLLCGVARAEPQMNIIRDAEIEDMLKTFAKPIFEAAGLDPSAVHFVLVQDNQINAFVAGGSNMFIYTGLLRAARTPDELIGVMAHETGHIAGGHLVRTREEMRNASATAILATIAGVAAAVASRDGGAGAAAVSIGNEVAQRGFLSYSRTQESAADQAGLSFLDRNAISAVGMRDFLQRLEDQEMLPSDQQSEYVRTHPLTRERVEAVTDHINNDKITMRPLPASYEESFRRMLKKLDGFLDPRGVLQKTDSHATDFATRYARAIAFHQTGDTKGSVALIDQLLRDEPENPYLFELKGQVQYESGHAADAIPAYRKAVALSHGNSLLRLGLAQALMDSGNQSDLGNATTELEAAINDERGSPLLWRLLATAYGRRNDLGMAAYALSEEALARGDKPLAVQQAKRAQAILNRGSPGWIKAGDVLDNASVKDD